MNKEYVSPEAEFQKFTIYCDEMISQTETTDPDTDPGDGGNEFDF